MKNIFFLLFSASSAAVENKCDMDECVSCTIVNMRLEGELACHYHNYDIFYKSNYRINQRVSLFMMRVFHS